MDEVALDSTHAMCFRHLGSAEQPARFQEASLPVVATPAAAPAAPAISAAQPMSSAEQPTPLPEASQPVVATPTAALPMVNAEQPAPEETPAGASAATDEVLCTDRRGFFVPVYPMLNTFAFPVLLQDRYTPCVVCTVRARGCDDPRQLYTYAGDLLTSALGKNTQSYEGSLQDFHAIRQIMAHVDGAKFVMLIRADVGHSDVAHAIGVGSSQRGVIAAAQLALAAFVFAFKLHRDPPDPTSNEAFSRLVVCIRTSTVVQVRPTQGPVGDTAMSDNQISRCRLAAPPAVVYQ